MTKRPKGKPGAEAKDGASDVPFEEALAQLEKLIDRIESGKVGLEESIAEYEKGAALLKHCRSILDRAEQRITELTAPPAEGDGAKRAR